MNIVYEKINNFIECDPCGWIREVRQSCVLKSSDDSEMIEVVVKDEFSNGKRKYTIAPNDVPRFINFLDTTDDYSILPPFAIASDGTNFPPLI